MDYIIELITGKKKEDKVDLIIDNLETLQKYKTSPSSFLKVSIVYEPYNFANYSLQNVFDEIDAQTKIIKIRVKAQSANLFLNKRIIETLILDDVCQTANVGIGEIQHVYLPRASADFKIAGIINLHVKVQAVIDVKVPDSQNLFLDWSPFVTKLIMNPGNVNLMVNPRFKYERT